MKSSLPIVSAAVLTGLVGFTVVVGVAQLESVTFLYRYGDYANLAGYIALVLIAASGVMMLFRRQLLGYTRNPDIIRAVHVGIAGLGGGFLVIHVEFFLLFPLNIPVLFGYMATYSALAVWVTGSLFFEGLRGSVFYHGLLALIGVALMVVHVFSAGRGLPDVLSGVVLVLTACSVLAVAVKRFSDIPSGAVASSRKET